MSYYNDRPKLQAVRNRRYVNNYSTYPEDYGYRNNHNRRGVKRGHNSNDEDVVSKKRCDFELKPSVTSPKNLANDRLKNLRKNINEDKVVAKTHTETSKTAENTKSRCQTQVSHTQVSSNVSPSYTPSKNIASQRLAKLRNSLEAKPNNKTEIGNKETDNKLDLKPNVTENKIESNLDSIKKNALLDRMKNVPLKMDIPKPTTIVSENFSPPSTTKKSVSDRLKVVQKTPENNNEQLVDLCSPITLNSTIRQEEVMEISPEVKTVENGIVNDTTISAPVVLEKKNVNKEAFTAAWLANTNFDGESSSLFEASTQAKANDTVANLESISPDDEMDWASVVNTKKMFSGKPVKSKDVCVVVDTNIFIHNLQKIRDLLRLKVSGPNKPILYVPWMVIQELDFLKEKARDNHLQRLSKTAVNFLNENLTEKNPRLTCQDSIEAHKQLSFSNVADDKVIASCIQAKEKYDIVFLFSNDVNLKNKAMIHDIPVCSGNDVVLRVMSKLNRAVKFQAAVSKVGMTCTCVIIECVKQEYGPVWNRMDLLNSNHPWPLIKCLRIFKRYWAGVFRQMLLKQFLKCVDEILTFLNNVSQISDDSQEYIAFVKLCVHLCVFLKDANKHRDLLDKTIKEITKMEG